MLYTIHESACIENAQQISALLTYALGARAHVNKTLSEQGKPETQFLVQFYPY